MMMMMMMVMMMVLSLISYPYGGTINSEICMEMQLKTHQPPIAKASQAAAWSYKYSGDVGKAEGSPIGFVAIFRRLKSLKIP